MVKTAKIYTKAKRAKRRKKIKSVDPFFCKKGRSADYINPRLKQELKYNQPPKNPNVQEIPRSLNILMKLKNGNPKYNKKVNEKVENTDFKRGWNFSNRDGDEVEMGMTRPLKKIPDFVRLKDESTTNFLKRVGRETRRVIQRSKFEIEYDVTIEEKEDGSVNVNPSLKSTGSVDIVNGSLTNTDSDSALRDAKQISSSKKKISLDTKNKCPEEKKTKTEFEELHDYVPFGEVVKEPPNITCWPNRPRKKRK